MDKTAYKEQFAQEETAGWNAINEQLKKVTARWNRGITLLCCTTYTAFRACERLMISRTSDYKDTIQ